MHTPFIVQKSKHICGYITGREERSDPLGALTGSDAGVPTEHGAGGVLSTAAHARRVHVPAVGRCRERQVQQAAVPRHPSAAGGVGE